MKTTFNLDLFFLGLLVALAFAAMDALPFKRQPDKSADAKVEIITARGVFSKTGAER